MKELDKERIDRIYEMLMEISDGKFFKQIGRTEEEDALEDIVILLNFMAQEYSQSLTYYSHLHTPDNILLAAQMMFLLNKDFSIEYVNTTAANQMGYPMEVLEQISVTDLLDKESIPVWKEIANTLLFNLRYEMGVTLKFKSSTGLVTESFCHILSLVDRKINEQRIWITSFEPRMQSQLFEVDFNKKLLEIATKRSKKKRINVLTSEKDIERIQDVKSYVDANLAINLPSLKVLANTYCINEHKLKYGFKQLYGTTVYRYVTNERLKKAHLLILNTGMPFSKIITRCGFKNFSHFSAVFKAKYGYSPKDLQKISDMD